MLAAITFAAIVLTTLSCSLSRNEKEIDMSAYALTFDEPFDALDVSAWGPGTRWISHTPWNGDFGDARFADPGPESPFVINKGILEITLKKVDGKWVSGLLSSIDKDTKGFQQTTGYWEMKARLPGGPGVWPAFWLSTVGKPGSPSPEIDALEFYGHQKEVYMATMHVWKDGNHIDEKSLPVQIGSKNIYDDFHLYGVAVESNGVFIYLDRQLVATFPAREEYLQPKAILLNLGAGGGWPITGMKDPSVMYVDYVRAYKKKE